MIISAILSGVLALFILYLIIVMICAPFDIILWPFNEDKKDYPKLHYKQFIDYYWVNPDRWILYDNHVEYQYYKSEPFTYGYKQGENSVVNIKESTTIYVKSFSFSFINQIKYRKFKHDIETSKMKIKQSKAHNEAYQILLEGVQKDIDKLCQQSQDELSQAMKTMKEVKERIG